MVWRFSCFQWISKFVQKCQHCQLCIIRVNSVSESKGRTARFWAKLLQFSWAIVGLYIWIENRHLINHASATGMFFTHYYHNSPSVRDILSFIKPYYHWKYSIIYFSLKHGWMQMQLASCFTNTPLLFRYTVTQKTSSFMTT